MHPRAGRGTHLRPCRRPGPAPIPPRPTAPQPASHRRRRPGSEREIVATIRVEIGGDHRTPKAVVADGRQHGRHRQTVRPSADVYVHRPVKPFLNRVPARSHQHVGVPVPIHVAGRDSGSEVPAVVGPDEHLVRGGQHAAFGQGSQHDVGCAADSRLLDTHKEVDDAVAVEISSCHRLSGPIALRGPAQPRGSEVQDVATLQRARHHPHQARAVVGVAEDEVAQPVSGRVTGEEERSQRPHRSERYRCGRGVDVGAGPDRPLEHQQLPGVVAGSVHGADDEARSPCQISAREWANQDVSRNAHQQRRPRVERLFASDGAAKKPQTGHVGRRALERSQVGVPISVDISDPSHGSNDPRVRVSEIHRARGATARGHAVAVVIHLVRTDFRRSRMHGGIIIGAVHGHDDPVTIGVGGRGGDGAPQEKEGSSYIGSMALLVYGIPSCGTVKKARAALDGARRPHTFVDFRDKPPSRTQVDAWVAKFGARAMRNTSGGSYRALGPEKESWSDAQWADAFAADPMLIKRPIVERDGKPTIVGWNLDADEIKARLG